MIKVKRENSLEKILERKELTSIETRDDNEADEKGQDKKVDSKVQRLMAEMNDLKQAIKRDAGSSRQVVDQLYTAKFPESEKDQVYVDRTKEEFLRDLPVSRSKEDFDGVFS